MASWNYLRTALPILYGASTLLSGNASAQSAEEPSRKPLVEFSFAMRDTLNRDVFELERGQTNTLVLIANKPVETRLPTAGIGWTLNQTPPKAVIFDSIWPRFEGAYYGKTNDWFYKYPIGANDITLTYAARSIKRLRDDNGNFLPVQGPKVGKNAFAYYEIAPLETQVNLTSATAHNLPQSVTINYEYVSSQDSTSSTETYRVTPLQIAIVPKQRPINKSLLLYNITPDGTPWPHATGCVDETGKPRSMVLQRSTNDITGPWANAYTNSITAENPYGSINFIDTAAKGRTSFYRAVSLETAKQAGKASLETQAWTSSPAR